MISRFSWEAVMSRKQSSSAPSRSYTRAISTGSPASCSSRNFTPLTTRPALTSRQGIILFVSIGSSQCSQEERISQCHGQIWAEDYRLQDAGDPVEIARVYDREGAD